MASATAIARLSATPERVVREPMLAYRDLGDRHSEAEALIDRATSHRACGDLARAGVRPGPVPNDRQLL